MHDPHQRKYAHALTIAGLFLAVAMNVLRALTAPEHAKADWKVVPYLIFINGMLPVLFYIAVKVALSEWRSGPVWSLVRFGGLGAAGAVLAVVSYENSRSLLHQWGASTMEINTFPAVFEAFILIGGMWLFGAALNEWEMTEKAKAIREEKERREHERQQRKARREAVNPPASPQEPEPVVEAPQTALPPVPPAKAEEGGSGPYKGREKRITRPAGTVPGQRKGRARYDLDEMLEAATKAHETGKIKRFTASAIQRHFYSLSPRVTCSSDRASEMRDILLERHTGMSCKCGMTSEDGATPDAPGSDDGPVVGSIDHHAPAEVEADMVGVAAA
jgi:hypothetical protein